MSRELKFYCLVTGLTIQLIFILYYFVVLFPDTLSHSLKEGELSLFLFLMLLMSPATYFLISTGNKEASLFVRKSLILMLFLPVPLALVLGFVLSVV